jgi:hypothetical protein
MPVENALDTEKADTYMITVDKNYLHSHLTNKIIACVYDVYNQLGSGFSEKVYENAMVIKIAQRGLTAVQQTPASWRIFS